MIAGAAFSACVGHGNGAACSGALMVVVLWVRMVSAVVRT